MSGSLLEAVGRLPPEAETEVRRRARALADKMEALEPGWRAPHAVLDLGDARFDRLVETLADQPCPLLDDSGGCRISIPTARWYVVSSAWRPGRA